MNTDEQSTSQLADDADATVTQNGITTPAPAPVQDDPYSDPSIARASSAAQRVDDKSERAPRTDLESDLREVLNQIVRQEIVLPEGVQPTPHYLAGLIQESRGSDNPVSAGAVTAALKRWSDIGFVTLGVKPTHFISYTDAGRTEGLSALKAKAKEARKAARDAEKAANQSASTQASSDES